MGWEALNFILDMGDVLSASERVLKDAIVRCVGSFFGCAAERLADLEMYRRSRWCSLRAGNPVKLVAVRLYTLVLQKNVQNRSPGGHGGK